MSGPPRLPATMLVDLPNWVGDQMMAMPALNRLIEGNRGGETCSIPGHRWSGSCRQSFPRRG